MQLSCVTCNYELCHGLHRELDNLHSVTLSASALLQSTTASELKGVQALLTSDSITENQAWIQNEWIHGQMFWKHHSFAFHLLMCRILFKKKVNLGKDISSTLRGKKNYLVKTSSFWKITLEYTYHLPSAACKHPSHNFECLTFR